MYICIYIFYIVWFNITFHLFWIIILYLLYATSCATAFRIDGLCTLYLFFLISVFTFLFSLFSVYFFFFHLNLIDLVFCHLLNSHFHYFPPIILSLLFTPLYRASMCSSYRGNGIGNGIGNTPLVNGYGNGIIIILSLYFSFMLSISYSTPLHSTPFHSIPFCLCLCFCLHCSHTPFTPSLSA